MQNRETPLWKQGDLAGQSGATSAVPRRPAGGTRARILPLDPGGAVKGTLRGPPLRHPVPIAPGCQPPHNELVTRALNIDRPDSIWFHRFVLANITIPETFIQ